MLLHPKNVDIADFLQCFAKQCSMLSFCADYLLYLIGMNPKMITWARERADFALEELANKSGFKRLREWEEGTVEPTQNQLFMFAKKVHIPHGFLYLPEPPAEDLESFGLEDFRTVGSTKISKLSPNLIDTIADCASRSDWYHDNAVAEGIPEVKFVGTAKTSHDHRKAAVSMAKLLNFGLGQQQQFRTVRDAFNAFCEAAENAGVLVMKSSHVGSNTHRPLKTSEFRGFALSDRYAPLVFVNKVDSVSAQMFTLAHELAHLWLGDSGVSSVEHKNFGKYRSEKERWCNQVGAELLVPMDCLSDIDVSGKDWYENIGTKARSLKVSKDVIFLRLLDGGRIDRKYSDFVRKHADITPAKKGGGGGRSQAELVISRVGRNFASALISSTLARRTLYKRAYDLLGVRKTDTLREMGKILGV